MMMESSRSMMNWDNMIAFFVLRYIVWAVVLVDLILLGMVLWKQLQKK